MDAQIIKDKIRELAIKLRNRRLDVFGLVVEGHGYDVKRRMWGVLSKIAGFVDEGRTQIII